MHGLYLHRYMHLFQLHLDREFLVIFFVLEEPFFDTLPRNKELLRPTLDHFPDFFQTNQASCHIYSFGEHVFFQ